MKKFTLLFAFILSFSMLRAQEVNTEQWTMISKRTADWCTFCGSWGWNLFEDLIEDNKDKNVILWATHFSGDLANSTSMDFTNSLGGNGQPLFFVNRDNMGVTSGNVSSKREEINLYVNDLISFQPFAGIGLEANYDNGLLTVDGKVQFFTSLGEGNFYLSYYLVKDHVIAPQTSQGSMADHRYLMTDEITGNTFGENIVQGAIENNEIFTLTSSKEIENVDIDNDEVVAILWNLRTDGVYEFFNANRVSITSSTGINEPNISGVSLINTRLFADELIVNITTDRDFDNIQTRLLNVSGQQIDTQLSRAFVGENQLKFNTSNLMAGTYLLHINIDNQIFTEKIIIH